MSPRTGVGRHQRRQHRHQLNAAIAFPACSAAASDCGSAVARCRTLRTAGRALPHLCAVIDTARDLKCAYPIVTSKWPSTSCILLGLLRPAVAPLVVALQAAALPPLRCVRTTQWAAQQLRSGGRGSHHQAARALADNCQDTRRHVPPITRCVRGASAVVPRVLCGRGVREASWPNFGWSAVFPTPHPSTPCVMRHVSHGTRIVGRRSYPQCTTVTLHPATCRATLAGRRHACRGNCSLVSACGCLISLGCGVPPPLDAPSDACKLPGCYRRRHDTQSAAAARRAAAAVATRVPLTRGARVPRSASLVQQRGSSPFLC